MFDESEFSYKDGVLLYVRKLVVGVVFEVNIDNIYLLFYGYDDDILFMFKINNMIVEVSSLFFIIFVCYIDEFFMVGFSDKWMVVLMVELIVVMI